MIIKVTPLIAIGASTVAVMIPIQGQLVALFYLEGMISFH